MTLRGDMPDAFIKKNAGVNPVIELNKLQEKYSHLIMISLRKGILQ